MRRFSTKVAKLIRAALGTNDIYNFLIGKGSVAGNVGKKLEVVRRAARHDYPVGDIEGTLAEIEEGYGTDKRS
ncbi:MAG: hypothetical protein WBV36_10095 [Terriglobales bacterium]